MRNLTEAVESHNEEIGIDSIEALRELLVNYDCGLYDSHETLVQVSQKASDALMKFVEIKIKSKKA